MDCVVLYPALALQEAKPSERDGLSSALLLPPPVRVPPFSSQNVRKSGAAQRSTVSPSAASSLQEERPVPACAVLLAAGLGLCGRRCRVGTVAGHKTSKSVTKLHFSICASVISFKSLKFLKSRQWIGPTAIPTASPRPGAEHELTGAAYCQAAVNERCEAAGNERTGGVSGRQRPLRSGRTRAHRR